MVGVGFFVMGNLRSSLFSSITVLAPTTSRLKHSVLLQLVCSFLLSKLNCILALVMYPLVGE